MESHPQEKMGYEAMVESLGIEVVHEANPPEQGDVVCEIIGPNEQGYLDLQLPNVWRAIVSGAAAGASHYVRTHASKSPALPARSDSQSAPDAETPQ